MCEGTVYTSLVLVYLYWGQGAVSRNMLNDMPIASDAILYDIFVRSDNNPSAVQKLCMLGNDYAEIRAFLLHSCRRLLGNDYLQCQKAFATVQHTTYSQLSQFATYYSSAQFFSTLLH